MKEKELGERNFGFDSLKSRLNHDMEEKGIVARDCLPPAEAAEAAEAGGGGARCRYNMAAGSFPSIPSPSGTFNSLCENID